MKQTTFASTEFVLLAKRTLKRELPGDINLIVPWTELTELIHFAPANKTVKP
jgi:hypothetical protein